jgi:adenylate cyclase class IV
MVEETEYEIKVLEAKEEDFVKNFPNLFKEKYFEKTITTWYVYKKLTNDEEFFFRVREYGDLNNVELTIKSGCVTWAKESVEKTEVVNYDAAMLIIDVLKTLGHAVNKTVKTRSSYIVDECKVEFDNYKNINIPEFMEIEFPNKNALDSIVKKLNIDTNKIKYFNFEELKEYYSIKI